MDRFNIDDNSSRNKLVVGLNSKRWAGHQNVGRTQKRVVASLLPKSEAVRSSLAESEGKSLLHRPVD